MIHMLSPWMEPFPMCWLLLVVNSLLICALLADPADDETRDPVEITTGPDGNFQARENDR